MYFIDQDGEELILTAVVMVDPVTGNAGRESYTAYLTGGQHVTIKESFKTRASFIIDWKAANV